MLNIKLLFSGIAFSFLSLAQNPLNIPPTLSGSDINLTLQNGTVQFLPGNVTNTRGVNGDILGPTIILDKGQQVTMNVTNSLGEATTIHWHGMHVPAAADGGPHVVIDAGTTWSPSWTVMDVASTHWYHPHLHMNTNKHVQQGIAGMIIVRDPIEQALTLPNTYGVDDFPIVVQTKAFDANNQIIIESALDVNLMVNGTLDPFLDVPAQFVRLRLLNGSSERYYNFGFTGDLTFQQIGSDGGLLSAPVPLTRLMLAPGERADVVIDLSTLQGQSISLRNFGSEITNGIYGAVQPGMGAGQVIPNYTSNPLNGSDFDVLQLNVVTPTASPVTSISPVLVTHTPWLAADANELRTFVFEPQNMGSTAIQGPFMINNAMFNMDVINHIIPLNNIEIWELTNMSPITHPFHLHDVSFYVLAIDGATPPLNMQGKKDVISVPPGGATVRFITKFEDFADDIVPYMYHCHMLPHEDMGMMGQFIVTENLSVNENDQNTFAVYPNPTRDQLMLKMNANFKAEFLEITDQCGRIVKTEKIPSDLKIDLMGIKSGIYFIKVGNNNQPVKFIKE